VWASGAAVVTNVAGNLLLVPQMGIAGAALVPRVEDLSAYRHLWCRVIRGHGTSEEPVMGRGAAK
jgi:hypothetical protein